MKTKNTKQEMPHVKQERQKLVERKRKKKNRISRLKGVTTSQNKQLAEQRIELDKFLDDLRIKHD